jgi:HEAT repeat protein
MPRSPPPPTVPAPDPAALTDAALIAALPEAGLQDYAALAREAGRRRLAASVPALARLCRRFAAWGGDALVPEQVAALEALARIGGREAASAVAEGIARAVFTGPTLRSAAAAAAALDAVLPEESLLALLRHDDPPVREHACRCARLSSGVTAALVELLDDLHPPVRRAAACALGRIGRIEAKPVLLRLLQESPNPEIIAALAVIADPDCLILLGRLARRVPVLTGAVIDALEASDHPQAAALAAALQDPD